MKELDINEVYILCTKSIADGRIGEFFQSRGAHTNNYRGNLVGSYYFLDEYGLIHSRKTPKGKTRINPWRKHGRKFPRKMMVSNDQQFWVERMIHGKIKADSPYINVMNASTVSGKVEKLFAFKYTKEI